MERYVNHAELGYGSLSLKITQNMPPSPLQALPSTRVNKQKSVTESMLNPPHSHTAKASVMTPRLGSALSVPDPP